MNQVEQNPEKPEGPKKLDPEAFENNKILIVDDDSLIVRTFKIGLSREGYRTFTASTGYDAGFATKEFDPDCILLDINLPDIDGDIVLRRLRQNPDTKHIKVIGVSATSNPERLTAMERAGIDGFIPKPAALPELVKTIKRVIGDVRVKPKEPRKSEAKVPPGKRIAALAKLAAVVVVAVFAYDFLSSPKFEVDRENRVARIGDQEIPIVYREDLERSNGRSAWSQAERSSEFYRSLGYEFDDVTGRWLPRDELARLIRQRSANSQSEATERLGQASRGEVSVGGTTLGEIQMQVRARNHSYGETNSLVRIDDHFVLGILASFYSEEIAKSKSGDRFYEGKWFPRQELEQYGRISVKGEIQTGFLYFAQGGSAKVIRDGLEEVHAARDVTMVSPVRPAPYAEYWNRAALIGVGRWNPERHYELGLWCESKGFDGAAAREFKLALVDDPSYELALDKIRN
ncbi:MAG: response regulator [Planctomycetes bacterium]|nr:response regulator [Planctomycetota bacterium]